MDNLHTVAAAAAPDPSGTPLSPATLVAIRSQDPGNRRPLLFHNATIHTRDPLIGTIAQGDILIGGATIVGIGPGLVTAAGDDNMLVIDCTGLTVVPAIIDALSTTRVRPSRADSVGTLIPGRAADFIVIGNSGPFFYQTILDDPSTAAAIVLAGEVRTWNGRIVDLRDTAGDVRNGDDGGDRGGTGSGARVDFPSSGASDVHGTWISEDDFLHQHLIPGGRYDETRGGRRHAFQGQYWINGNRIDYLDDLGFWAYGEFIGDTLHHAGYVMRRR